jgi:mono/diheme cytochrome c family protein
MSTPNLLAHSVVAKSCGLRRTSLSESSGVIRIAGFLVMALMLAALVALRSSEARTTWSQSQSTNGAAGNSQNGKLIFERVGCNKCHGSEGEGVSAAGQAPGVPRIASTSLALPAFLELVRKSKGRMPPFGPQTVSDAELGDVYAFLQSLKPSAERETSTPGSLKNGERLFVSYGCYECHGYLGQGSSQTRGSRLGPPQIPLSAFVSYVREPSGQMPPYAAKAVSDRDLAEIYDFLRSVPPPAPLKSIPLLNQ